MDWNLIFFQQATFLFLLSAFTAYDYVSGSLGRHQNKVTVLQMLKQTLVNMYCISLPISMLFSEHFLLFAEGELYEQILRLLVCILLEEILFYSIHRLLHLPVFYRSIHKLHHQIVAPIALSTLYVDPIDHLLLNVAPVLISPSICSVQGNFLYLWCLLVNISSIVSHCGYNNLKTTEFHELHHRHRNVNYGVIGLCDKLLNTSAKCTMHKYS